MTAGLIYIHGFISSPQSLKAQLLGHYVAEHHSDIHYMVPSLSNTPAEAFRELDQLVQDYLQNNTGPLGLVGSSMGGFFATALAERYRLAAVLVNPAVQPHTFGEHFIGAHHNPYTGVDFSLAQADIDVLQSLVVKPNTGRYWVMVQEQDETLDYRNAVEFYNGVQMTVEAGGDHSFQNFDRHLAAIVEFLQLSAPAE
ncbi:MAG: putative esterase YcpF (UPF0227 family) [Zhongshania marina]|jgi:predicted esterase YcpF (UPF0227 family)